MAMAEPLFRWAHIIAGILWIGLLYYFNWINGVFTSKLDADTKQKGLPELLPRALYFFRWGAAYTWITGVALLGLVFYMNPSTLVGADTAGAHDAMLWGLAIILVGAGLYDVLWSKVFAGKEQAGVVITFLLVTGIMYSLTECCDFTIRGMYIHIGGLFGTCMAMNVWMRIWPAQRKIIAATKAGEAPDKAWGAVAGLRSKHNTYMSVPLVYMMINQHTSIVQCESVPAWGMLAIVTAVSWVFVKWVYKKSKTEAPAFY